VPPVTPTRDRILDAAWQIAAERGPARLTLRDVGHAAGVSRQAVYLNFANRAGLLLAMARRIDHSSGFVSQVAATRGLPAREGFVAMLRAWFAHLPVILPVARVLEAAVVTGDDGAAAYTDRMDQWWETIRISVCALASVEELREGWGVDEATDWVWSRTHPATYHHLTADRGWTAERTVEIIVASVLRDVATGLPTPARGPRRSPES
jgi:AcrR family transcriptional regulator